MRGTGGRLAAGVAAATMALACGGGAKRTEAPAAKPEQDGLWRFAPAGTRVAVVLPDGKLQEVADALLAGEKILAAGPEPALSAVFGTFEYHGVDLRVADQRATAGFDPQGGMAVFHTATDRLSIYPVPDADAYRRRFGVKRAAGPDGLDVDREGAFCVEIEDRYACAQQAATLRALREGKPPGVTWGAGPDGHMQVYLAPALLQGLPPLTSGGDGVRATVILRRGALRARLRLAGRPAEGLDALAARRSPLLDRVPLEAISGLTVLDLRGPWSRWRDRVADRAAGGVAGGVHLEDLLRGLRGDLVAFSARTGDPPHALLVGLARSQPVERMLRSCEDLDRAAPGLTARRSGDRCRLQVEDLAALGIGELELHVEGDALVVSVDQVGRTIASPSRAHAAGWAARIHEGRWAVAGWGTGLMLQVVDEIAGKPETLAAPGTRTGLWALLHVVELALTLEARPDALVADLELGTSWAYPDALQAELEPLLLRAASGERVGGEIAALAATERGAALEQHLSAGSYGVMSVVLIGALGAGVAIGIDKLMQDTGAAREAVVALEELAERACGCQDEECVAAAWQDYEAWHARHGETQASEGQLDRIRRAAERLGPCLGADTGD